jgi:hypothetical protein
MNQQDDRQFIIFLSFFNHTTFRWLFVIRLASFIPLPATSMVMHSVSRMVLQVSCLLKNMFWDII